MDSEHVLLWLMNTQTTHDICTNLARNVYNEILDNTERLSALENRLKDLFECEFDWIVPLMEQYALKSPLYQQTFERRELLQTLVGIVNEATNTGLSEIDWREVAQHYLTYYEFDMLPYEEGKE